MSTVDELAERIEDLEEKVRAHTESQTQWADTINELNNLVAAMKGHAQLVEMQPSEDRVQEMVKVVQSSTTRVQELIRSSVKSIEKSGGETSGLYPALDPATVSILVVDDELLIRSLLYDVLVKTGYNVDMAGSGTDAIADCKDKLFDIILMDFRLGDMDGVQALRKIREFQTESRVIFLTGDPSIEEIQAIVLKEGADGFITKPFDLKEILDAIQHILMMKDV